MPDKPPKPERTEAEIDAIRDQAVRRAMQTKPSPVKEIKHPRPVKAK